MPPQFTLYCLTSVRDEFNEYCDRIATPEIHRRLTGAFEAFHELLSGGSGTNPPIRYVADPPTLQDPVEMEVRISDVRFSIEVDFSARLILLEAIHFRLDSENLS